MMGRMAMTDATERRHKVPQRGAPAALVLPHDTLNFLWMQAFSSGVQGCPEALLL
jgi:hypothetical protein